LRIISCVYVFLLFLDDFITEYVNREIGTTMKKIATIRGFLDYIFLNNYAPEECVISLLYEGEITHQIMKAFTSMTETSMGKHEESTSVSKRVFHVMVECLQNIGKHADPIDESDPLTKRGIFLVSKTTDCYSVITGNHIDNNKLPGLKASLESINESDNDTLKEMYKKQIRSSGGLSEKGGAGLGFIDIARKTGEKLKYDFVKIDDRLSFFILKTTVYRMSKEE
jgi:hypothetical protein